MQSLYSLKPRFQDVLRPYAAALVKRGLTPNQVTIATLSICALCGLLVALFSEAWFPLILLAPVAALRLALNAIDGLMAREHGLATPGGQMLNEVADVGSDMVLFLPLALVPEFSPVLVALTVMLAVLTEVAGIAALGVGGKRRYDGPMGKSDRAVAIGLLALLTGLGILPAVVVNLALAVVVGAAFLTLINRVNGALEDHAARVESRDRPSGPA